LKDQGSLKNMLGMDKTLLYQLEMEEIDSMQTRLKVFQCHSAFFIELSWNSICDE
jgi:hypothetical protein